MRCRVSCEGDVIKAPESELVVHAHNIFAPVVSNTAHKILLSHSTGTRVLRYDPSSPPGIEPISNVPTREKSTFPNLECKKLVTPVKITACTISVPTITLGA